MAKGSKKKKDTKNSDNKSQQAKNTASSNK